MTFNMPPLGAAAHALSPADFQAGGKGVNASKAVAAISRALPTGKIRPYSVVFPGGTDGRKCVKFLRRQNFCRIVSEPVDGDTRTGLVCVDAATGVETTFLGAGTPVGIEAFARAMERISDKASPRDIVALCGSFPGWSKKHARELRNLRASKKLIFCADTYGPPLGDAIAMGCDLLKINRYEFFSNLAKTVDGGGFEVFKDAFEKVAGSLNLGYFSVTDGGKPALFKERNGETFSVSPPRIEEVSSTGCGDIMFACLAFELFRANTDFKLAAARAVKWASLEAGRKGICSLSGAKIAEILGG